MIQHVVTFRLNGSSREQRDGQAVLAKDVLEQLRGRVPGLTHLRVAADFGTTPTNWHLVLVTHHESTEALDEYIRHPLHVAVKSQLDQHVSERAIVDSYF
ncbi:hypothetical protein B1729_03615 [Microbacterium sp. B35-04]|uniref:Dabb family protein n=1 Tax=unclassified Microbacterium TaxID=2609290 RepID=UPI0013D1E497|nr:MULTISPECIES: Dabb family protein [unclassified Microbacterium]KAF2414678.1 hypothetical protein B1729_03615 [Microbacterium sp. B35-04]KAF2417610.1 hypothetical protein B2K11_11805 [Microbacterium sp. B35-30]